MTDTPETDAFRSQLPLSKETCDFYIDHSSQAGLDVVVGLALQASIAHEFEEHIVKLERERNEARADLADAKDDALRLHKEKMEYFDANIKLHAALEAAQASVRERHAVVEAAKKFAPHWEQGWDEQDAPEDRASAAAAGDALVAAVRELEAKHV